MMEDVSLMRYLEAVAARTPAPGGGSVAGVAGALAAAIATMAVRYSQGKKSLAAHEPFFAGAVVSLERARQVLLALSDEDERAFAAYQQLKKEGTAQEQAAALAICIRVPEAIGSTALAVLRLCEELADKGNVYLLSDVAVAAELATATVRCAQHNVKVNVPELQAADDRRRVLQSAEAMRLEAVRLVGQVMTSIARRQEAGA